MTRTSGHLELGKDFRGADKKKREGGRKRERERERERETQRDRDRQRQTDREMREGNRVSAERLGIIIFQSISPRRGPSGCRASSSVDFIN